MNLLKELTLPSKIKNLYNRLGLEHFASISEARTAYFRLALKFHPNLHHEECKRDEKFKKAIEFEFLALYGAYDVLRDPARKAQYDEVLRVEEGISRLHERTKEFSFKKDFKNIIEIDFFLSRQQKNNLDYLDYLIDSGSLHRTNSEDPLGGLDYCIFCSKRIPKEIVTLSYQGDSLFHFNNYIHAMFSHGMRAGIIEYERRAINDSESCFETVNEAHRIMVDSLYRILKITVKERQLFEQGHMLMHGKGN